MKPKFNHLTMSEIVALCADHAALIAKEIAARKEEAASSKGFLSFDKLPDIRGYRGGNQFFAVDGSTATGLMVGESEEGNIFVPAIMDGAVYASYPDEGQGGIAHLCFLKQARNGREINRWIVIWTDAGWLSKDEFENLTPVEIGEALVEEILAGENVITRKPPGWV